MLEHDIEQQLITKAALAQAQLVTVDRQLAHNAQVLGIDVDLVAVTRETV